MSFIMCAKISFKAVRNRPEVVIYKPSSVKIESSFKNFTETAYVVLPRNVGVFAKRKVSDVFVPGDPIIIELGYNGNLYKEFEGYITNVNAGIPVELRCENEMYHLKQGTVSVSLPNATVRQLLQKTAPGYKIDCPDIKLGTVRYSQVAPIKILEQLKQKTGLYTYFDGIVLRCGTYGKNNSPVTNIILERNAIQQGNNVLSKKEVNVRVRAISIVTGGKRIEVTVGDTTGTLQILTYVGITAKMELEKAARRDYERIKLGSLDGKLELFGIPRVTHGQRLHIESYANSDINGTYYADKVEKVFSDHATYRQYVELGDKQASE